MSAPTVEFYFDYGSPTAYLAYTQLPAICARNGAQLEYKPILLGAVFKATGNQTPVAIKAKGQWMMADMERFARHYGVPYKMNPHFIINSLPLMRGAVWAQRENCFDSYNRAIQQAMWVDGIDLGNSDEVARVLSAAGLDAGAMAVAIQSDAIKNGLVQATNEAVGRGVFGAPTMFVNGAMHFGQDRLDWVERALQS